MSVRTAVPADVPVLVRLVHELAEYEKAADECRLTEDRLHAALFGEDPSAGAFVAVDDAPGDGTGPDTDTVVGLALWFRNFSTWEGEAGIHLEDLYVRPECRGGGHGAALLAALAAEVTRRGWRRLEWNVLDWNTPAIGFYRSIGATPNEGWTTYRLAGDGLAALAGRA